MSITVPEASIKVLMMPGVGANFQFISVHEVDGVMPDIERLLGGNIEVIDLQTSVDDGMESNISLYVKDDAKLQGMRPNWYATKVQQEYLRAEYFKVNGKCFEGAILEEMKVFGPAILLRAQADPDGNETFGFTNLDYASITRGYMKYTSSDAVEAEHDLQQIDDSSISKRSAQETKNQETRTDQRAAERLRDVLRLKATALMAHKAASKAGELARAAKEVAVAAHSDSKVAKQTARDAKDVAKSAEIEYELDYEKKSQKKQKM
jgi:hypothetical protein